MLAVECAVDNSRDFKSFHFPAVFYWLMIMAAFGAVIMM